MNEPPNFFSDMKRSHPQLMEAYEALSRAARQAGPLDEKSAALVKLALSIGAGLEGATHSSVRKALAAGCSTGEVRHVALLAVTTLGFPSMMRARAWIEDLLG
jgi:alkylhydroperoxidase/carboxymuconolactone decarboxylase family protein YurZ